jgi:gliding motility-associated-like protein
LRILSLLESPKVNIRDQLPVCRGTSDTLRTNNHTDLHLWSNGSTASFLHVTAPGLYWVQLTNADGCKSADTALVTQLYQPPQHFLPEEKKICEGGTLNLGPVSNYTAYSWSTGAGTKYIMVTQPGDYILAVTDNNGCVARDTSTVIQEVCSNRIYFPSAFTPDKDGLNDVFRPLVTGVLVKFSLVIYNRWGQEVYRSTDPLKGWNGALKGLDQDSGNFVWVCTYQFYNAPAASQKGSVVLIR